MIVFCVLSFMFIACSQENKKDEKPVVATSTFALYDIVSHIAGTSVEVMHILPFGVEPHDYEPTPKLVAQLEKAKVIFYSGAGLEPWMEHFAFQTRVLDLSRSATLLPQDPHYWLNLENMQKISHRITQELITIMPQNKQSYLANEKRYIEMLTALDKQFSTRLKECTRDTLVVGHNAYGYLAKRYNFKVASLSGFSVDAQPSARDMKRIIEVVKEQKTDTIFFEKFANPKALHAIADETGVVVDTLQPLGNITVEEVQQKLDYEQIMKQNLEKIAKGLGCH